MRYPPRRTKRFALAALVAGIVASSAYAFTASNTVPGTSSGSGAGAISGYTVSSIAYSLNASNPQNIDAVTFTLDKAATTVKAQLVGAGSWYSCSNTGGNNWSCATTSPQMTAATATQLTVVATQ
jgi:hypothetical protein